MNRSRRTLTCALALAFLGTIAAACGDDAEGADPADEPTVETTVTPVETTAHTDHDATTVMIDGVDYGFEEVPATVPVGTQLGFRNTSSVELHELVAFRLDTDRPLDELLALPPAELEATLGAPVTVLLQPPGAPEAIQAVGDGTVTEPGRYVLMCFIPIGADPQEYLAAAEAAGGGKPEGVAGGPPHFTAGMVAEFVVE